MRKWISVILCLCLLASLFMPVFAEEPSAISYIQKAIQYYYHYQEDAKREITDCLTQAKALDPGLGILWENIMRDWSWSNTEMPIYENVLPDGLPQDDSLCIVILGYSLKDDGSLEDELLARLQVGLESARKYPNAFVAVTGGGTAKDPSITEAGQMAAWLRENGVAEERIIIEDKSLSTNENAVNTYRILRDSYPSVNAVAVVSSDYHLGWGCAMFKTMYHYVDYHGGRAIDMVANAAAKTGKTMDTMFSQAWGVSVITHTPFDLESEEAPALYWVDETVETQSTLPAPAEETQPVPQEPQKKDFKLSGWMILAAVVAMAVLLLNVKEKQARKRRRRENPVWKARELERQQEEQKQE